MILSFVLRTLDLKIENFLEEIALFFRILDSKFGKNLKVCDT